MLRVLRAAAILLLLTVPLTAPLSAQEKRLWVLRAPGEMVEYDPATFAMKHTIKVPAEAVESPQSVAVNHLGQILFAPAVSLPLAESDVASPNKAWFWNGQGAITIDLGITREVSATGSNHAVAESSPAVYLSADGVHLFWFANQARRLARDGVDLSTETIWVAWRTNLSGGSREELASAKFPDCRCSSGACEETCPYGQVWAPGDGVGNFVFMTQFVAGRMGAVYKQSSRCQGEKTDWTCTPLPQALRHVLDATPDGSMIVEAIPDTGCCGWSNQSDDQTQVLADGETRTAFDEFATYKNSDYDVSFYTSNARLSPSLDFVAMTIAATAGSDQPIQLAEQGQANPEESKGIRKALAELPAVEIKSLKAKSVEQSPRGVAFLPHATLVGWINEKEILIVEDHVLSVFNIATGTRRRSSVHVDDADHVFLR